MAEYAATQDSSISGFIEMAMTPLPKALGKRIRKIRKATGVSQDILALSCGLDRSYVGRIERGEVNVTIEKIYKIASSLGCEPADFLPPLKAVSFSPSAK